MVCRASSKRTLCTCFQGTKQQALLRASMSPAMPKLPVASTSSAANCAALWALDSCTSDSTQRDVHRPLQAFFRRRAHGFHGLMLYGTSVTNRLLGVCQQRYQRVRTGTIALASITLLLCRLHRSIRRCLRQTMWRRRTGDSHFHHWLRSHERPLPDRPIYRVEMRWLSGIMHCRSSVRMSWRCPVRQPARFFFVDQ